MSFNIDPNNGVAIYEQVARQVKFAVAAGGLETGDLVPSVRELARDLAINPNTVARAYRELQTDGVLETVRGTGLSVTRGARKRCQGERVKLIRQRLRQAISEAAQSQIAASELRELIEEELARSESKES